VFLLNILSFQSGENNWKIALGWMKLQNSGLSDPYKS